MRIKYLTEDDLNAVKSNLSAVLRDVIAEDGKSLNEFFGRDNLIKETQFEINNFKLDMSQPNGKESLTDVENIQRVYNHMKFLSDSQASDERIWAAYTFSEFLDYMRYRWKASMFRSSFHLKQKDIDYINEKGLDVIRQHAQDFIAKREAPAFIPNDGKQTPMKGHPVFIAQHATATCCRECIRKWHKMLPGRELSQVQQDYLVDVIMTWIEKELARAKEN